MSSLKGYHHVILPDGRQEDMVVVEFDPAGRYVSRHPLTAEEPFVEWVGGVFEIKD